MAVENRASIVLSATDKTGAAFASAKRNILGLQSSASGIAASFGPLLGTVGLLGSALSLLNFKSLVNGVDALNDLKDATGASIENISALEDVAARTGTSFDTVGTALVKFNAQLKEATPGSGPEQVLKAIGLSAEELKRIDPAEALRLVSVALGSFADDGNKARITQELFGKSVREVAPFLNDLAKQGQLNAKVTTEQAEAAEKFNQQMAALGKNFKDAARSIVGDMLPALNQFFSALNSGGGISGIFTQIDRELKAKFDSVSLRKVTDDIVAVQTQINDFGPSPSRQRVLDQLTARYEELRKKTTEASEAMKKFAPAPVLAQADANAVKPSAPKVPGKPDTSGIDKARQEALANLRKVIDGRVKAIAEGLDNERDIERFHEEFSRALYGQGVQSLEKFYADQDAARAGNLAAVRRSVAAEIAERQKLLDSPLLKGKGKDAERQEVQNQIEEARAKLRAAEREADQAGQLAAIERQRATEALRDDVAALDAQIQSLAGNAASANLLDIANKVRDAQRLLVQGGDAPDVADRKVQQLRTLLTVQQQFNTARDNLAAISDRAAIAEERLLRTSEQSGAGLLETEAAVAGLRRKALGEIEALIAKTRELVEINPGDTALVKFLQDLQLQAERAREQIDPTKLRLDGAANDIGGTLADGFGRALKNVRDIKSILADVGNRVFDIVNEEIIVKPLATQLSGILKGAGGQGTGENILTTIFGIGKSDETGKALGALTSAASGSADVLGKLPQLAAIPATTSIVGLGGAAQIASQALLELAGSSGAKGGAAGIGNLFGSSFGLENLTGGGFGTGADFGLQDFGLFLDRGGYTGNKAVDEAAGVVHGQEFVFSAPATKRLGVGVLDKLHQAARSGRTLPGYQHGGYVGMAPRQTAAPASAASAANAQQLTVNAPVTINVSGPVDRRTTEQIAREAGRSVQRAVARGTA